ncbi:MAG: oxidoreductase [Synechococcus sp. CPC35]|nr:oxidoreductase [Synechococcus sp. CPC35]
MPMAQTKAHNLRKVIIVAITPSLITYALAIKLSAMAGIKGILVIRDLAQTCDSALGIGLISNLGYLLWIAPASIALFTAYGTPTNSQHKLKELLLCGGWFSFILCIDDMFLLHDRYIGQTFLYVVYAIFAFLIVFRFRDQLIKNGGEIFILAATLLAFSILTDKFQRDIVDILPVKYETTQIFEEGVKFLGISSWFYFWWTTSSKFIRKAASHEGR